MIDLHHNMIKLLPKGAIIHTETASYLHGLTSANPNPLSVDLDIDHDITTPWLYARALKYNKGEDLLHYKNNLYITDKYRTVCDMIKKRLTPQHILEAIETIIEVESETTLIQYAERYSIEKEMQQYITEVREGETGGKWINRNINPLPAHNPKKTVRTP